MSIAINQLSTLLSSTIIFVFIILLVLMSIKLMQTYRNKYLHLLFIGGLGLGTVQQLLLIYNFDSQIKLVTYIISTAAGMVSFIIINYVLMKLSIGYGKLKPLPYILFSFLVVLASLASFYLEKNQSYKDTSGYGLPILELTFIVIVFVLIAQIRVLHLFTYHFMMLAMLLVNMLAHLFHHYLIGEYTMWLHMTELITYIVYYLFVFMLLFAIVTEKMMQTYRVSLHDQMTSLYIRANFIRKCTKLFEKKPIAIIFCDIDNFKQLNDTKGHLEADQVLIKVAHIIKNETAKLGYAGRYGGEEIVAGIDISHDKPDVIAEHIRKRVAEETSVTVSIGVSTSKDSIELTQLLKYADDAMYYSKSTGKNKVSMYKSLPATYKNK